MIGEAAANEMHTVKSVELQDDMNPKKDSMRNKNEDGGSSSTEKHDQADAIDDEGEEFKESDPPRILVSPSVTTGYDFPGPECEYQIMSKLPTPNTSDPIMKARTDENPRYRDYETAQNLTQAGGRGMRFERDFCENFSVDNLIPRHIFGDSTKDLYPAYFRKQYKKAELIPAPPPRLWGKR